jgi:spore coat polysaccharide biosynthesis predicted glycosyltransferase SpsG
MRTLFVCRATAASGLGHLIRTKSLAATFAGIDGAPNVTLLVVGEPFVLRLLHGCPFPYEVVADERGLEMIAECDYVFFDMLTLGNEGFLAEARRRARLACVSPIFDRMGAMDLLFHRTRHLRLPEGGAPKRVFAGLEYAVIPQHCQRIGAGVFENNLEQDALPVAIAMGGGDAANKTLRFLRSLKSCPVPATFWVMLGEGYQHSYDRLIQEISADVAHEIILARTNRSMWEIMKNCALAILPGGITAYEAAYAGLPTIALLEDDGQRYLVEELVENGACIYGGPIDGEHLAGLHPTLEALHRDRHRLMQMHVAAKRLIDGLGGRRIREICGTLAAGAP